MSGGGWDPWGGTTVVVSPDIWISVAIPSMQPVAEVVNAVNRFRAKRARRGKTYDGVRVSCEWMVYS